MFVTLAILAVLIVSILLWCKIFSKTGYHWAFGLLILIPFGNLIVILILAFSDWPILKELSILKDRT
jgi:hypothetical protein